MVHWFVWRRIQTPKKQNRPPDLYQIVICVVITPREHAEPGEGERIPGWTETDRQMASSATQTGEEWGSARRRPQARRKIERQSNTSAEWEKEKGRWRRAVMAADRQTDRRRDGWERSWWQKRSGNISEIVWKCQTHRQVKDVRLIRLRRFPGCRRNSLRLKSPQKDTSPNGRPLNSSK